MEKARLKFMYILMPTDMVKTYLKTDLLKILLAQLRSDIDLQFEAIDFPDFLKTAVTLASFQKDGNHFFLRDKLNSSQVGRQIVFQSQLAYDD